MFAAANLMITSLTGNGSQGWLDINTDGISISVYIYRSSFKRCLGHYCLCNVVLSYIVNVLWNIISCVNWPHCCTYFYFIRLTVWEQQSYEPSKCLYLFLWISIFINLTYIHNKLMYMFSYNELTVSVKKIFD